MGEAPANTPMDDASTPVKLEPSPVNEFAVMVAPVVRSLLPKSIASDDEVMEPSARVRFPTVEPVARVAVPVLSVPVVAKFSSPKDIDPFESVIEPSARVRFPIVEPVVKVAVPVLKVPVVDRASFPKSITSDEDVIDPFARVRSPISDPDEKVDTPAFKVPFVERFSLPNDISSEPDAMVPSVNVRLPMVDPELKSAIPVLSVPVVDRSSSPKSISLEAADIEPSSRVRLPMVEPEPELMVPSVVRLLSKNDIAPLSDVMVPLSMVISPTYALDWACTVVKFPVCGFSDPIIEPSIVPPLISILSLSSVAMLPSPSDALATESLSTVHSVPSETMKLPSACSRDPMVSRSSLESCFVSMYAFMDCCVAN